MPGKYCSVAFVVGSVRLNLLVVRLLFFSVDIENLSCYVLC